MMKHLQAASEARQLRMYQSSLWSNCLYTEIPIAMRETQAYTYSIIMLIKLFISNKNDYKLLFTVGWTTATLDWLE